MTVWEALAVVLAGLGAGAINAVVGSGTLITFPVLLAVGYPPVLANVSNNVGLVLGGVSTVLANGPELAGQRARLSRLGIASAAGGATGAVALLVLPSDAFRAVVPVLIAIACVLVVLQPRLSQRFAERDETESEIRPALVAGVFATGVYGGFFGAAQGVMLIALLGVLLRESLQRVNAAKNLLSLIVNVIAALIFVAVTHVAWLAAGLIAMGSIVGGQLGARLGRRVSAPVLRGLVVLVGVVAIVSLLAS